MSRFHLVRRARRVALGLRALLLFAVVEVGLRTSGLPRLCRRLGVRLGQAAETSTGGPRRISRWAANEAASVVGHVSRRWPWGDTCLRRCLVLGALLSRTRPTLVLGVKRAPGDGLAAHAWLEFGGVSIDPMSAEFTPVSP